MPGRWVGSDRRTRLPVDWARRIRPMVLRRDNFQCTRVEHGQRCPEVATDVDHIDRHGPNTLDNLASLCAPHHRRKTAQEGNRARTRRQRAPEPHPGLRRDT